MAWEVIIQPEVLGQWAGMRGLEFWCGMPYKMSVSNPDFGVEGAWPLWLPGCLTPGHSTLPVF